MRAKTHTLSPNIITGFSTGSGTYTICHYSEHILLTPDKLVFKRYML